jgi:hypothetical protein
MRYSFLALAVSVPAFALIAAGASAQERGLAARVAQLEAQVAAMEEILQFVRVETEEMDGLAGPHWIIEGTNVHVRSGSGDTTEGCGWRDPDYPNCERLTGLGNLIVGYNERFPVRGRPSEFRTGSHNLVVGRYHSYSSFAGFVAGSKNRITGAHASVSGGKGGEASGDNSSVSGGHSNEASGFLASVSGGQDRVAPDEFNWAAGELFEPN